MISRTYQVNNGENSQTYKGFNRRFKPTYEVSKVALFLIDGELEVFVLDDGKMGESQLIKYLAEQKCGIIEIIGIFRRK